MEQKFFVCKTCGKIIAIVNDTMPSVMCCGKSMERLVPNTVEASTEKHLPVYKMDGSKLTVTVGSTLHPMEQAHYIEWISLQTNKGNQRKALLPGQTPTVTFLVDQDEVVEAVYAYCNLHGLWKA